MKAPTMNSNIIMIPFPTLNAGCEFAMNAKLPQFSIREAEDGFGVVLSTPVTANLEDLIPGILHGAKARQKDKEKPDPKPPTGGGDGTPNGGGTPGTPVLDRYTYTEARAA